MVDPVKSRAYDSPVRRERARQTRLAILGAARARFLEVGYASTTVASVAAGAGVSVDAVYAAFGGKRGLLAAVMDVNVGGDDEPVAVLDRELPQRMRDETDQRTQLSLFAVGMAGELERMRPLDDVLRSAAAADPEVAAARRLQNDVQRHAAMVIVVGWVRARGPLRDGLDVATAADLVWTLTSPEVHHMFLEVRGWTREQYETWLGDALEHALLPPA
ncbi:MAG TPA: helix-turn-helix domain-containing protein [Mycobacteriales bacterium]|jgi:AcrR family transcriptional regulator|nr:helix-turn-helix domain-containing protein [Mycobacteriales bacterium]